MQTLHTTRLVLRPFRKEDEADVHRYAADPEVTRYMNWGPNADDETAAFLARVLAGDVASLPYAIERREDGRVIGGTELMIESEDNRRAQMGYVLARDAWGQGYATEAAQALLDHARGPLGFRRVSATCDPDNPGSARVLEKIGMNREGRLHDYFFIRGEWRDRLLYAAAGPL